MLRLAYPPILLILYPLFSSSSTNPLKLLAYCSATVYSLPPGVTSLTIPGTLEGVAPGDAPPPGAVGV